MSLEEFHQVELTLFHGTNSAWEDPAVLERVSSVNSMKLVKKLGDFYGEPIYAEKRTIPDHDIYAAVYRYYTGSYDSEGLFLTCDWRRAIRYAQSNYSELEHYLMKMYNTMTEEDRKVCFQAEDLEYMSFLQENKDKCRPLIRVYKDVKIGDLEDENAKQKIGLNKVRMIFGSFRQISFKFLGDPSTLTFDVLDFRELLEKEDEKLIFEFLEKEDERLITELREKYKDVIISE